MRYREFEKAHWPYRRLWKICRRIVWIGSVIAFAYAEHIRLIELSADAIGSLAALMLFLVIVTIFFVEQKEVRIYEAFKDEFPEDAEALWAEQDT